MSRARLLSLLNEDDADRRLALDPGMVDVSHLEGVPVGSLGSGHSVFGRNGFQRVAFDGPPDTRADFTTPHALADFAFFVVDGDIAHALQQRPTVLETGGRTLPGTPAQRVHAYAALPKAYFRFELADAELVVTLLVFSPLVPHDLESSATPVQICELAVRNRSNRRRRLELWLAHREPMTPAGDATRLCMSGGELAFAVDGGTVGNEGAKAMLELAPETSACARFFVAWYFPEFRTPSPAAPGTFRRWYAKRFANAAAVIRHARAKADAWSEAIEAWRDSIDVPPEMKRLWFSSLSVAITTTLLSEDPYFFAVEVPHEWVNTMDVAVYTNWIYLVHWPELERRDLEQYFEVVATEGETAGFVPHSLWSDAAHYAEEPTFILRLWRMCLWGAEPAWLPRAYEHALAAARCAHARDAFEHLLNTKTGNQSYDEWMMPGVSAYVNVAWLYALHALARMAELLDRDDHIDGREIHELANLVRASLLKRLWSDESGGYFRCFYRTPGASDASNAEAVFTDQLFGRWLSLLEESSGLVLPPGHLVAALNTAYGNNLLTDEASGFRGWVNGMLPGRRPDLVAGYHARTCWLGAQLDLAALLAGVGYEAQSLDVFRSVETSLGNNHIAVGEWNRAIDATGKAALFEAWGKDTPRFPPYPRYASCWEYLLRMLGLTVDRTHLYLQPFRTLRFELRGVRLAGSRLWVSVEPNWRRMLVSGVEMDACAGLRREQREHHVRFVA